MNTAKVIVFSILISATLIVWYDAVGIEVVSGIAIFTVYLAFWLGGVRRQYRVEAPSEKEAYFKKIADMAKFKTGLSLPENQKIKLASSFSDLDYFGHNRCLLTKKDRYERQFYCIADIGKRRDDKGLLRPDFVGARNDIRVWWKCGEMTIELPNKIA